MTVIKKLATVVGVIALTLLLLMGISKVLTEHSSQQKYSDFYTEDTDYDVLFFGSSRMVMGVAPMELWKDYGITSYNMADFAQELPTDYWTLRNALNYTTPKLVVIETYMVDLDEKYSEDALPQVHHEFDTMPLSTTKLQAVFDLFDKDDRLEFLLPFSYYHSRWSAITEDSFSFENSTEKGANLDSSTSEGSAGYSPLLRQEWDVTEVNDTDTIAKQYLCRMIELCQSEDIPVLLVVNPGFETADADDREGKLAFVNSTQTIADRYGVTYLNTNYEEDYINYATDFLDARHLDSSGARKYTAWLGQYLMDNYGLTAETDPDTIALWNADYEKYKAYKIDWLKEQTDPYVYLMLCADDDWDITIQVSDPAKTYSSDNMFMGMLDNLGVDVYSLTEEDTTIQVTMGKTAAVDSSVIPEETFNSPTGSTGRADYVITVTDAATGQVVDTVACDGWICRE